MVMIQPANAKTRGGWGCMTALIVLAVMALAFWGLARYHYPSWNWHQKMTVSVQTPAGPVSGSSVIGVRWTSNFFSGGWGGATRHARLRGEAVTVELGDGRYLFMLLAGEGTANLPTQLIAGRGGRVWTREAFNAVRDLDGPITLPPERFPRLVTFTDIADPASVSRVDPDDLEASFGPGYRLQSITLEITDEPVTTGRMEQVLGWWSDYENLQLDGERYRDAQSQILASHLNRLDFKKD